jgi:hypothetical protein
MPCFKLIKAIVPVSLLPSRLRRLHEGVTAGVDEQLNALLLTYVPLFEGVVISYRRVHIHGEPLGCVNGLYPYINFKVSADFIVFAPEIGSQLVGKIKKVGPDLINVLVHGLFTVVLDKTGIPEQYCFDSTTESWIMGSPPPPGAVVKGGLSKTAKKKLLRAAQAQAAEGKQSVSLEDPSLLGQEDPGADRGFPRLAPDVWLKFSILSLDLHNKIYQWKATARGQALGVVPALSSLHEPTAKDMFYQGDAAPLVSEIGQGVCSAGDGKKKGRKKQRVL